VAGQKLGRVYSAPRYFSARALIGGKISGGEAKAASSLSGTDDSNKLRDLFNYCFLNDECFKDI
jgi:hypothetical protein